MSSSLDSTQFRRACSKFATGVAVVTAIGRDGAPYGMTVNSFTSVSLDPPLILICVDNRALILEELLAAGAMAINVLNDTQREVSTSFARRDDGLFDALGWSEGVLGTPLLPNVLAVLECSLHTVIPSGDHHILVGEVRHVQWTEQAPLLYFDSGYQLLG